VSNLHSALQLTPARITGQVPRPAISLVRLARLPGVTGRKRPEAWGAGALVQPRVANLGHAG